MNRQPKAKAKTQPKRAKTFDDVTKEAFKAGVEWAVSPDEYEEVMPTIEAGFSQWRERASG